MKTNDPLVLRTTPLSKNERPLVYQNERPPCLYCDRGSNIISSTSSSIATRVNSAFLAVFRGGSGGGSGGGSRSRSKCADVVAGDTMNRINSIDSIESMNIMNSSCSRPATAEAVLCSQAHGGRELSRSGTGGSGKKSVCAGRQLGEKQVY